MDSLEKDLVLNLPDEVIEYIMSFLSLADLRKLSKAEKRLEDCARRVSKMKPFHIAIVGGGLYGVRNDVEVISIVNYSVLCSDEVIPSVPNELYIKRGGKLSNGDLICEGYSRHGGVEYWRLEDGANKWENVGKYRLPNGKEARWDSTFMIDDCLVPIDNSCTSSKKIIFHELFTRGKESTIDSYGHTATLFGQDKLFICGGYWTSWITTMEGITPRDNKYWLSQKTFIYDIKEDSWIEGKPLLRARAEHSSCVIPLDDKPTHCIVIGGKTKPEGEYAKSTEIFSFKNQKWVVGPTLPYGIKSSECIAGPQLCNFACIIVGGHTQKRNYSQIVFALNKNLSEWIFLGTIKNGRYDHIAIPVDKTI